MLIMTACKKDDTFPVQDITDQVQFLGSGYFGLCFSGFPADSDEEVIIRDQEAYAEYFDKRSDSDCDTAALPQIDFSNFTLIGKYTQGGGCDVSYDRKITDNEIELKIIYTIKPEYGGQCYMLITNMNWALIPKLKKNYEVEFIVE